MVAGVLYIRIHQQLSSSLLYCLPYDALQVSYIRRPKRRKTVDFVQCTCYDILFAVIVVGGRRVPSWPPHLQRFYLWPCRSLQ